MQHSLCHQRIIRLDTHQIHIVGNGYRLGIYIYHPSVTGNRCDLANIIGIEGFVICVGSICKQADSIALSVHRQQLCAALVNAGYNAVAGSG